MLSTIFIAKLNASCFSIYVFLHAHSNLFVPINVNSVFLIYSLKLFTLWVW
jgi:hypothetical protein